MMDKYFIETGDDTTYWFATGKKPSGMLEAARVTKCVHRSLSTDLILEKAYLIWKKHGPEGCK